MITTEQPTRYEEGMDANITKQNYVSENICALPNVDMLEQQWEAFPPAVEDKSVRCALINGALEMKNPQRFYMNRLTDVTGVSGTGQVLNGVIMPSGKVFVEWKYPHRTIGIYDDFKQFLTIHVESHPDANEVVFID